MNLLFAVNSRTRQSLLFDLDGSGTIQSLEQALRSMAHEVFTAINESGSQS